MTASTLSLSRHFHRLLAHSETALKAKPVLALLLAMSLAPGASAWTNRSSPTRQRETRPASPKETANKPRPRTDVLGDPLPPGVLARMGTSRLHHFEQIRSLVFSPDGKLLHTSDASCVVGFWDVATGKPLAPLRQPPRGFILSKMLAPTIVSPDGKIAAAIDAGDRIQLWRPDTGAVIHKIAKPLASGERLAFSAEGTKLAATHRDNTVRLWDTATGREVGRFGGEKIAFTPYLYFPTISVDGKTLTAATRGGVPIRVWDVESGREIRRIKGRTRQIQLLALSPDGSLLIVQSTDANVRPGKPLPNCQCHLWSVATGEELPFFRKKQKYFDAMIFSPDGRMLATANREGIRLWEIATGKERRCFQGHRGTANCLAFSRDGRLLASGGSDRTALVWEVASVLENDPALTDRRTLWMALADSDAARAHKAMCLLIADRAAVLFLRKQLRPAIVPDAARMAQLIADLDSDRFTVRQQATRALEKKGDAAEATFRKVLAEKPTLEVRRRIEHLLTKLREPLTNPQRLQTLRGIEVLEYIGTPEARQVLAALGEGAPVRSTREAKTSLRRLQARSATKR